MEKIKTDEAMEKASSILKTLNSDILTKFKGKIIAIDPDSGKYFIGDSELDAYKKAIKECPAKQFVYKRIGFDSTHFVGAL